MERIFVIICSNKVFAGAGSCAGAYYDMHKPYANVHTKMCLHLHVQTDDPRFRENAGRIRGMSDGPLGSNQSHRHNYRVFVVRQIVAKGIA